MRPVGVLGASWAMTDNKEKECGDGMWEGNRRGGSERVDDQRGWSKECSVQLVTMRLR